VQTIFLVLMGAKFMPHPKMQTKTGQEYPAKSEHHEINPHEECQGIDRY
jgi:hypothetical protein